jgi:hypothetical protein
VSIVSSDLSGRPGRSAGHLVRQGGSGSVDNAKSASLSHCEGIVRESRLDVS